MLFRCLGIFLSKKSNGILFRIVIQWGSCYLKRVFSKVEFNTLNDFNDIYFHLNNLDMHNNYTIDIFHFLCKNSKIKSKQFWLKDGWGDENKYIEFLTNSTVFQLLGVAQYNTHYHTNWQTFNINIYLSYFWMLVHERLYIYSMFVLLSHVESVIPNIF